MTDIHPRLTEPPPVVPAPLSIPPSVPTAMVATAPPAAPPPSTSNGGSNFDTSNGFRSKLGTLVRSQNRPVDPTSLEADHRFTTTDLSTPASTGPVSSDPFRHYSLPINRMFFPDLKTMTSPFPLELARTESLVQLSKGILVYDTDYSDDNILGEIIIDTKTTVEDMIEIIKTVRIVSFIT
jgi:hypothetical protein